MGGEQSLVVGNGTLVTFGAQCRLVADGALLLEHGLIAKVGTTAELRSAHPQVPFLDARGGYILPGMICAHTHTYGAFARGMALKDPPPKNFVQILEHLWWRLDRALTAEDVYYSALVCLVDAIKHGTTTLIDHHASPRACSGSLDVIAQAFHEAGLRGCLCYEVSDRDGREAARAGIRENERFMAACRRSATAAGAMLAGMMGLHASFTLCDETLREAVDIATAYGAGCHIHVAEDKADVADSLRRCGKRTVHRLLDLGVLGPRSLAAHCVHVDEGEMAALADSGTWVAHNARSNMNNAVGTAPLDAMLDKGVRLALGNDGFSNDMFAEMKAAYLAQKAAWGDTQAMPADRLVAMSVGGNAQLAKMAFGGGLWLGELAVGAAADVIVVDYQPPTPVTAVNLPWHLIFGIDGATVTTTIVDGRVLMRDRRLLTLDEGAIATRARAAAARLWERF